MIWQIKKQKHKVFARNPLDTVVAQLKFQPILRIGAGKDIANFQETVRKSFPGFGEGEIRNLTIGPDTQVSTKVEKVYHFIRPSDDTKVQLSSDNVMIEAKKHRSRDELISDFAIVIEALERIYSPIDTLRFGVRYINIIRPDVIKSDLKKETSWATLIDSEYLKMPAEITDLDQTYFANQISSSLDVGGLVLRYGIPQPQTKDDQPAFTFDIDRYIDSDINLDEITNTLTQFTDDIFSLFQTLPGIDLTEWMSKSDVNDDSEEIH